MILSNTIKLIFRNTFNYVTFSCKAISVVSPNSNQLLTVSSKKFNEQKKALRSFGFNNSQVVRMLNKEPDVIMLSKDEMLTSFTNWYRFKISERDLLNSMSSCPKLLLIDSKTLQLRIKELLTLFTQNDILNLLKKCPQVYYDDLDLIKEKVQYFVNFMGVEQGTIIKNGALKFDFDYIQLRHNFLLHAGKFKKANPKLKLNNPTLDKILHKNVNTYLRLSGLTFEEYDVYESVFHKLLDFEEEADLDDETDDDDDDLDNETDDE